MSTQHIHRVRRDTLASTTPPSSKRPRGARPLGGRPGPTNSPRISGVEPLDDGDPQSGVDTEASLEVTFREETEPGPMEQSVSSPASASFSRSARLIRGHHEFNDTTRTKTSVSASAISFGDPYGSPSSLPPSLPYVVESVVGLNTNVIAPVASPPLSRPPSVTSLRHPPSTGVTHVPKSPRTHWAQLRRAVLPEEPPLPVPEQVARTSVARTIVPTPSIYSLSQQIQQKSSRFARFGFRQQTAASEASHAAVTDTELARRFATDLHRACQSAKLAAAGIDYGTTSSAGPGPSQILPTPTFHAYGHQNSDSVSGGISSKIGLNRALRRPPSLQSIGTQPAKQMSLPQSGLHQVLSVLEQYSAMPGVSSILPGESEVLNTLLTPFLDHYASGRRAEDARLAALEGFDVLTKHWRSASPDVSLYRV